MTASRNRIAAKLRMYLLNRYVITVFSLPALGYLGFLSQFVVGEPGGPVRTVLEVLFLFSLPVMHLYSTVLGVMPSVDQELGTVGFFVFSYVFAVVLVLGIHVGLQIVRDQGLI